MIIDKLKDAFFMQQDIIIKYLEANQLSALAWYTIKQINLAKTIIQTWRKSFTPYLLLFYNYKSWFHQTISITPNFMS